MHQRIINQLSLRGFRFIDGAPDGGAGGDGAGGDGGDGGSGGDGGAGDALPKSQEELNQLIQKRLARQKEQFKGFDDFKAKAEKWDQHEESSKTDAEKAITDAKREASAEVTQKFLSRLVKSEVKSAARDAGFYDPEDAFSVIDSSKLPVKDDEPDAEAIKKLVAELAEKKPHLVDASKVKKTVTTTPKLPKGSAASTDSTSGKGRAAAALRSLGKRGD